MPLVVLMVVSRVHGETWVVKHDGTGDAPTIQAAISMAQTGDVVQVGPGVYYEALFFQGKGLVLESLSGPSATILDGSRNDSSILRLENNAAPGNTVRGFTFTHGSGYSLAPGKNYGGGAIFALNVLSLTLEDNYFKDNCARDGGAICFSQSDPLSNPRSLPELNLLSNIFEDNLATHGGGACFIHHCVSYIEGNRFVNNSSPFDGGALTLIGVVGKADVISNEFIGNKAVDKGGAIWAVTSGLAQPYVIESNLFVGNASEGLDQLDTGSGAAMGLYLKNGGIIRHNTIVRNDGRGESYCSGGGIMIQFGASMVDISYNIIANNQGCGIACYMLSDPESIHIGPNIFWENDGGNIGSKLDICPPEWEENILEFAPRFCNPHVGNYEVQEHSPALDGPIPFGAFPNPGCGSPLPVEETTWGKIKALFHEGP